MGHVDPMTNMKSEATTRRNRANTEYGRLSKYGTPQKNPILVLVIYISKPFILGGLYFEKPPYGQQH